MKDKYDTLLKKTDDEIAELKKLQDTSSMQAIVPLLYLRKCKRTGDDTTNESYDANTTPKTPANPRGGANIDRTQSIISSTQDEDGRDSKE
ncbi:hypothetical protein TELCIR_20945 [Teladorsagia circumcincta]|uniref:Uncharacterized protein n=1 Tax=Teladorsagia circumcincta TaxID=45464 RepID=A0A2G9TI46_TELCI|nr:hypothetical protein TELCIR_20945 [Teladorsagia circumcincta]